MYSVLVSTPLQIRRMHQLRIPNLILKSWWALQTFQNMRIQVNMSNVVEFPGASLGSLRTINSELNGST